MKEIKKQKQIKKITINKKGAGFVPARRISDQGITLIALVITIVVLLILTGVTILTLTGENGILNKSKTAKEETTKETATELLNLKITNAQMQTYVKEMRMPSLKELSLFLKDDNEISYVTETSKKLGSAEYDVISENPNAIYTKLNEYPYEFEIDNTLRLASIDGVKIADTDNVSIPKDEYAELKETCNELKTTIANLQNELNSVSSINLTFDSENWSSGTVTCTYSKHSCTIKIFELVKKSSANQWVKVADIPVSTNIENPSPFVSTPIQAAARIFS